MAEITPLKDRYYKAGQKNYKVGQVLQSGAKKLQSGAGITK